MEVYIKEYATARAEAIKRDWEPSRKTEGLGFLRRAELGQAAMTAILESLSDKDEKPTYQNILKRLKLSVTSRALTLPVEAAPAARQQKAGRAEEAMVADPVKAVPQVCRYFAETGNCRWGEGCKFKHIPGGGKGKDGGGKDGKGKFGGGQPKGQRKGQWKGGKGKGKDHGGGKGKTGGGTAMKIGDWMCSKCGDHQFARNEKCRQCGAPKPHATAGGEVKKADP